MQYRAFGNTGLEVSALGFGCMRFPVLKGDNARIDEKQASDMLHRAIDMGVNYLDTAYPYHSESFSVPGSSEPFLAKALKGGYREKVYLATKLPSWLVNAPGDMDKFLDEQLDRLSTEVIDFYLLHSMNRASWSKLQGFGVKDFLNRALASGKIRYAGFSYHDQADLFKEIVDAYEWSFCQIMYNYYDVDFQAGREGLHYAAKRGLGMVIMEPLRGGSLIKGLPKEAVSILEEARPGRSLAAWALGWIWNHPEADLVLSGMSDMAQVEENLKLASSAGESWGKEDEEAIEKAAAMIRKFQKVDCTSCGYCKPCPHGVDIPRNFSFINDHYMLQDRAAKTRYYGFLSEEQRASSCVQCGECLEKCPQQIDIPVELAHVAEAFAR